MKKILTYILFLSLFSALPLQAQESGSVFNFLSLPASSHAMAVGGQNVSLVEDDPSLIFQNPALASTVSSNTLGLNFLTYMRGNKSGSASFTRAQGERGTWGVGAQFVGYGKLQETDETGASIGSSTPLDVAISGLYSFAFNNRWAGGATGKLIYSSYAGYTSFAMAVDLGLNYYLEESDFSLSFVAANLGGQLKAFHDVHERLPFSLNAGFTKRMGHAPIRWNVTLVDLTHWSKKYFYNAEKDPSFGKILLSHVNVGVEVVPSDRFWIGLGWNFRRGYELKAAGSSKMAGLTAGAGLNIKKFSLGISYAKYHVSAPALSVSLAYRPGTRQQD